MFRHRFWPLSQLLSHWEPSCGGESERHAEPPYMDEFPLHKSECFRSTFFFFIKMEKIPAAAQVEASKKEPLRTSKIHHNQTVIKPFKGIHPSSHTEMYLPLLDEILGCHANIHLMFITMAKIPSFWSIHCSKDEADSHTELFQKSLNKWGGHTWPWCVNTIYMKPYHNNSNNFLWIDSILPFINV